MNSYPLDGMRYGLIATEQQRLTVGGRRLLIQTSVYDDGPEASPERSPVKAVWWKPWTW